MTKKLAILFAILNFSCTCRGVPKGFFLMSPDQQKAEFEKYDFETQYKIYICSQQNVEPPALELATVFAAEGGTIVKPLESKLEETDNDRTIRDIVFVFSEMCRQATHQVSMDKSLMDELRNKTSSVRDPAVREITEETFQLIRTECKPEKPLGGSR